MCLIVVAHNVSPKFPLVIAANRDEDYSRPSLRAHHWADAPRVMGGRDVTYGGSWLAIACDGRFAAVTNLRGARTQARSRGLLVRNFVVNGTPMSSPELYGGFNLIAGSIGGIAAVTSNATSTSAEYSEGIFALENDPAGVFTPKLMHAQSEMTRIVNSERSRETLERDLFDFLQSPAAFVATDRYGTRSSTVIIGTPLSVFLAERNFGRGGVPEGEAIELSCRRGFTPRATRS